jgi:alkanesulfonate monooxygenase SsuD/methylene tetrahydromethanopterin reductase-like flavin-dependent oxidoreductase (luciferase family)
MERRFRVENFDLWFTPRRCGFPIFVSAVFPKIATLCGEIADGIILTRSTLATAAGIRRHLAEGALRAGRDGRGGDRDVAAADRRGRNPPAGARCAASWLGLLAGFFPRYNRLIAEHGFATEAAAIAAAWARMAIGTLQSVRLAMH